MLLTFASATLLIAQDYDLDWSTFDAGGVMYSSSPSFTLSGTIGQPDADVLTGEDIELVGGFWPIHCEADFDADGVVDLSDLAELLAAYNSCIGDAAYIPIVDLDASGCINLSDLANLLSHYGDMCQ